MAKRALIAEPDAEEANRQAAILTDDGYEARIFTDGDLIAEVEQNPPDILILRHERPGAKTGFALVGRLKQVAQGTAIVITTSDLTPDAIEKNRKQKVHADGYLRLPVERNELVQAARAMPQVQEAADVATEQEQKPADPKRPPPLPASGLRGLSPLAKASPRTGGEAVLSTDDLTFVEKVFSTIQHIDAESPVNEPPPSAIGDAGDRKVALLRSELKRRERELAKLSRLWRAREEDLRQKESRVSQKDIEIEGLRLRVNEVNTELDRANQALVEKEAEFGRAMGETYDNTALQQAELIQQVASKENELNALKTKMRRAEDAWAQEKKEFTERIFEWEKAYAEFEQHHWKVMEASVDEVARLERQIFGRENDRKAVRETLKDRELQIEVLRKKLKAQEARLHAVEHEHGLFEEHVVAQAQALVAHERRARLVAEDEGAELRARMLDVEDDLACHQRVLDQLNETRRKEIMRMASVVRAGDAEVERLLGEREIYRARSNVLEAALNEVKALSEATANQLFGLEEKRRIVGEVQIRVRDEKLADLAEDLARLTTNLNDVTERLGQSEMEHASEQARAEDLDRALSETRELLQNTEEKLSRDLEVTTSERDKLADNLAKTESTLSTTKSDLAEAKSSRQQREIEVANLVERKDNEIASKNEKLVEFERGLADAKQDIQNLRKTVSVRDERITELLNRVRQADEQQVALEGQVFRLTSENTEKAADLVARDERIAVISQKLATTEDQLDGLETELRKTQGIVLDKQAGIERLEQGVKSLQANIATGREEAARLQAELQQRAAELFESERKASGLQAELANARSEIATGEGITDQLQAQLLQTQQRGSELRASLEESDAKLRNALVDLDNAGQRADQMRVDLAGMRERGQKQDAALQQALAQIGELERHRDGLQSASASLQSRLNEVESERHSLEEQLQHQTQENGALSSSLSDASVRLEEFQVREQQLENEVAQREGRIAAQGQVIDRAEKQSREQAQQLAEVNEELSDTRQSLADAKSAIDERARWLQTREAAIAELKAALDAEKQAREGVLAQLSGVQGELQGTAKEREAVKARLIERERLLQAQGVHAQQELEKEGARAEKMTAEARELKAALDRLQAEAAPLRAEAQRAGEIRAAEEKARAEALKMRQFAEKAANELRTTRANLEKVDAARKQAEADALQARAQLDDIKNSQKAGEQMVAQARLEGEQRIARMSELTQQVQRLTAAREASEKGRIEAEQEVAKARLHAEQELGREKSGLADQVQKLTAELAAAKKQRADAIAAAQQAKAESEQIKKLAAEKIRQAQAAVRDSAAPRPAAGGAAGAPRPATMPPTASPGSSPGIAAPAGARVGTGTSPGLAPPPQTQAPTSPPPQTPMARPGSAAAAAASAAPPQIPRPGALAPPSSGADPTLTLQREQPRAVSVPSAAPTGLAPPEGAPVTNPGIQMTSLPPGTASDPFNEAKTVLVERPVIPSAARGDKR